MMKWNDLYCLCNSFQFDFPWREWKIENEKVDFSFLNCIILCCWDKLLTGVLVIFLFPSVPNEMDNRKLENQVFFQHLEWSERRQVPISHFVLWTQGHLLKYISSFLPAFFLLSCFYASFQGHNSLFRTAGRTFTVRHLQGRWVLFRSVQRPHLQVFVKHITLYQYWRQLHQAASLAGKYGTFL